jgi:protein-tyrosine phosphatase
LYADILTSLGITHVVSVGRKPHQPTITGPFKILELDNIKDIDTECLSRHFPRAFEFMREAIKSNGNIFVHCEAGCSRSPAVLIAFLRANGYFNSLQGTYDHVVSKRPWINPNGGFRQQLRDFFMEPLK